jgi:hypothetical protein
VNGAVPVYGADGRLLTFAPSEWVEHHQGNLRLVRNRRGVLKRAYLRADDSDLVEWLAATGRRSSFGCAFEQVLSCGRVWALRGIRGSGH